MSTLLFEPEIKTCQTSKLILKKQEKQENQES